MRIEPAIWAYTPDWNRIQGPISPQVNTLSTEATQLGLPNSYKKVRKCMSIWEMYAKYSKTMQSFFSKDLLDGHCVQSYKLVNVAGNSKQNSFCSQGINKSSKTEQDNK